MNRRHFATMAAAIPAGFAGAPVLAASASESHPDSLAATTIHDFLVRVFVDGDLTAISDTFHPERFNIEYEKQFFGEFLLAAGKDVDWYFELSECHGDYERALSYCLFGPSVYDPHSLFMAIWMDHGKIEKYELMADLVDTTA